MSVFLKFSGKTFAIPNSLNLDNEIVSLFENLHVNTDYISLQSCGRPLSTN